MILQPIVYDVFSSERVQRYLNVGKKEEEIQLELKHSIVEDTDPRLIVSDKISYDKTKLNLTPLSLYERIIALNLLYGKYVTYIVSGGMGTGKTSTCEFVLHYIEEQLGKDQITIIPVNFNEGFLIKHSRVFCE